MGRILSLAALALAGAAAVLLLPRGDGGRDEPMRITWRALRASAAEAGLSASGPLVEGAWPPGAANGSIR